jgi:hypothetical protein
VVGAPRFELGTPSPQSTRPVLDNAVRICGAKFGTLYLFDDEVFELSHFPTPLAGFRAAQDAINIG